MKRDKNPERINLHLKSEIMESELRSNPLKRMKNQKVIMRKNQEIKT